MTSHAELTFPHACSVTVHVPVGRSIVSAAFRFAADELWPPKVARFCAEQHLPDDAAVRLEGMLEDLAASAWLEHRTEGTAASITGVEAVDCVAHWRCTLMPRDEEGAASPASRPTSVAGIDGKRLDLARSYQYLLQQSSSTCKALIHREDRYFVELLQLSEQRDKVMEALRQRQGEEMLSVSDGGGRLASPWDRVLGAGDVDANEHMERLARTHVEQVERAQVEWDDLFVRERQRQKLEFAEFVQKLAGDAPQRSQYMMFSSGIHLFMPNEAPAVSRDELRRNRGFTMAIGAQRKTVVHVRLVFCETVAQYCAFHRDRAIRIRQRMQHSLNMYSDKLMALVMLTDRRMRFDSMHTNRKLIKLFDYSPELHFDDFQAQLPTDLDEMENGDVVITRHSNLHQAHLLLHLLVDRAPALFTPLTSASPILQGLRNSIMLAAKHGVAQLAVPLLCLDGQPELTSENASLLLKRAEVVLQAIKQTLVALASADPPAGLTHLHLVVPIEQIALLKRYESRVCEVLGCVPDALSQEG